MDRSSNSGGGPARCPTIQRMLKSLSAPSAAMRLLMRQAADNGEDLYEIGPTSRGGIRKLTPHEINQDDAIMRRARAD